MKIRKNLIPEGRTNRPATNPASSLYGGKMEPEYFTVHNPYWPRDAKSLSNYLQSSNANDRPVSFHLSIDPDEAWQSLPFDEPGFHAGDNLGPGNTTTIGAEICDYFDPDTDEIDWDKYIKAEDNAAKVFAYLIKKGKLKEPFPEVMETHDNWSPGTYCPAHILGRQGGWEEFLEKVEAELSKLEEDVEECPSRYRLVTRSYRDPKQAEEHKRHLVDSGFSGAKIVYVIIDDDKDGKKPDGWFRVIASVRDTMSEARESQEVIKEYAGVSSWVWEVDEDHEDEDMPKKEDEPKKKSEDKSEDKPEDDGDIQGLFNLILKNFSLFSEMIENMRGKIKDETKD